MDTGEEEIYMIEIITDTFGTRKVIFHSLISKLSKRRPTKSRGEVVTYFYVCSFPESLRKFMGYNDKVYFKLEGDVFLVKDSYDGYTIKSNGTISVPSKFFNPAGCSEVLFEVDLNKSAGGVPWVVVKLA
jgi:hypothetical protein